MVLRRFLCEGIFRAALNYDRFTACIAQLSPQSFLAFFAFRLYAQTAPSADQSAAEAPQATPTPFENAESLAARGRLDKAMPILDGLAAQSPEPAGVERLRGMILYQKDQFPEAFKAFSKAADQDPQDRESIEMQG